MKIKIILFYLFGLSNLILNSQTFSLKSKDLTGQFIDSFIFDGFGCKGKNISPELHWLNAPVDTKSFAITMYDPDAPTGNGWWHWIVFDIDPKTNSLPQNYGNPINDKMTQSIQSFTDFGTKGYGGPCPPENHGLHSYIITIHALNIDKLGLDSNANPALVGFMINSHTISKASIISYYKR